MPTLAGAGSAQDGNTEVVARLLEERCASCHSPESDEPKARKKWPNARDLGATAGDPELVIPGDPEESELYLAVDFDDMPPPDSDSAPLAASEKELIAEWIRGGAPAGDPNAGAASSEAGGRSAIISWISHFHPLLVHFPLALLSAAFLAQVLVHLRPAWKTEAAASFCLALGALCAPPTAALGWLLAADLSHRGSDLLTHRILGTLTAVLALAVWGADRRWPGRRLLLLAGLAALVSATGHTGALLSSGAAWLKPPF